MTRVAAVSWLVALAACRPTETATPERLVQAHVEALRADDPQAAYALLSDEVRAEVPYETFAARWKQDAAERRAAIEGAQARSEAERGAVHEGTTVHDGGVVLRWTEAGDRYVVVHGLPGRPQTATPSSAVRAFIAAVRRADLSGVRAVLSDSLAAAIDEDWEARVDAIEAALEDPGALELSDDLSRAMLRYEPDRAVRLEQTPRGWRITALE